ncbi:MRN complex-interacting protein isoform X2 [Petromyzon marinus]|uniref:MRN complex-interacting protein isoform X2 n=1 Tax=Petromyzon marinus TaxID=7757 RepID=UPI003F6EDD09
MVDFQVLRCYACRTFQVHQVKSSSKFTCKMCGEKQSVKKVYAVSSGKDCRMIVQQLNRSQGEKHDQRAAGTSDDGSSKDDDDDDCGGNAADREPDVCGDVDAERSTLSSGMWVTGGGPGLWTQLHHVKMLTMTRRLSRSLSTRVSGWGVDAKAEA